MMIASMGEEGLLRGLDCSKRRNPMMIVVLSAHVVACVVHGKRLLSRVLCPERLGPSRNDMITQDHDRALTYHAEDAIVAAMSAHRRRGSAKLVLAHAVGRGPIEVLMLFSAVSCSATWHV